MKSFYVFIMLLSVVYNVGAQEDQINSESEQPSNDSINSRMPPPPAFTYLFFSYDTAGNQTQRFYCPTGTNCTIPDPPQEPVPEIIDELAEVESEDGDTIELIRIFPNPTAGEITVEIKESNGELKKMIESIVVYDSKGQIVFQKSEIKASKDNFNLSARPSGVYLVHIHFNDNSHTSKQIIKK